MSDQLPKWTFLAVSDADEPGDAVYAGMRHRDFEGVKLVLWPDADGWLNVEGMDRPERPLLLFFHGEDPVEDALAWLAKEGLDGPSGPPPFPTTFEDYDYDGGSETTRTVEVHLNYPPYPWLEETKLGMEMGRHFDRVELIDWIEPTESKPGTHTFRFSRRSNDSAENGLALDLTDEDLPF